jgi:hypothetical protein
VLLLAQTTARAALSGDAEIQDPEVANVVVRLQECCAPDWSANGPLEEMLGRQRITAPTLPAPRPSVEDDPDLPWWEKTRAVTVGAGDRGGAERTGGVAMPPPPPKPGPHAARPAAPVFTVQPTGAWHGQTGAPTGLGTGPGRPTVPRPMPRPTPSSSQGIGQSVLVAGAIALAAAVLMAMIVGGSGGGSAGAGTAFFLSGLFAFVIALPLLALRNR